MLLHVLYSSMVEHSINSTKVWGWNPVNTNTDKKLLMQVALDKKASAKCIIVNVCMCVCMYVQLGP